MLLATRKAIPPRRPVSRPRNLILTVSALALLAFPALGEEADPDQERREDAITVYGTSNPIPVFDYPGQVTVIARDQLERIQPSTMSDLLRDVPGLDFSGGPRRTGETPSIRGLGRENVLILLDGARQSFISAHDGRFFLDPELVRTAEVVRGPASALYGSGAVGGVLAFETVTAGDLLREGETAGVRVRTGYQSVNEEWLGSLTVFGQQGGFDGLVNLGVRQSGDIRLSSGADLPSDDSIRTGLIKLGYQVSNSLFADMSWQRFQNKAVEPNNGQGIGGTGNPVLDRNVDKDVTSETWRGGLRFDPPSDLIDTRLTLYRADSAVDEFDGSVPRTTLRDISTNGISLRNASRLSLDPGEIVITIGGDWYEDKQVGTDTATPDGARGGVPNGKSEFAGIFLQAEAEISRPLGLPGRLIVIPGIRYDTFESRSDLSADTSEDNQLSPRLGVSYAPASWLRLFGSYSEGFRAPSINELYLDGVHFPVPHPVLFNPGFGSFVFVNNNFVPNPALKPETSETIEAGIGLDLRSILQNADRLQGKVSYFESDVTDLINLSVNFAFDPTCFAPPTFFPCTAGTTNSANLASASLSGFEAEIAYDAPQWYARLGLATIEGRDDATGADIGALTPDRLALDLGIRLPERAAQLGTRIQAADEFKRLGMSAGSLTVVERRPGYVVFDLYASWEPDFLENVRIDAGVDNFLDHRYERVFAGVSEPGRNYKLSVSWQFSQ